MKKKPQSKVITDIIEFFTKKLWEIDTSNLTKLRKNIFLFFKWLYLVGDGFVKDQCLLRASALTYTTTLSIVPFLAVAFSIAKGFGFQNTTYIKTLLMQITAGREQVVNAIIEYVNRTDVTTLGSIGVATLLITVISLLSTIEKSFNVIWGVKEARSFGRKFTDYLSTTLIFPLLMIIAASLTASLKSNAIVQKVLAISFVGKFLIFITPFFSVGIALSFMYSFMPNTKVKLSAALGGGFIGGALWIISQWIYISFQIGVAKYNKIYGSFSQLPLFLFWLYISWAIILLGAEIAFAFQNLKTFQRESDSNLLSLRIKEKIAFRLLALVGKNFYNGLPPFSNEKLAENLYVPVKLINNLLNIFESASLILKIEKDKDEFYTLAKPPEKINIKDIIDAIKDYREKDFVLKNDRKFKKVDEILDKIDTDIAVKYKNYTLQKIINIIS